MTDNPRDLELFKKVQEDLVLKTEQLWREYYDSRRATTRLRDYTPEEIQQIINSGSLDAQQRLSRNYFDKNSLYKRIILYFATILKYYGILIPYPAFGKQLSTPHIQKRYFNALQYVDRLNLQELLTRMSIHALIDGAYYGAITTLDAKDGFAIIDLPTGYCCSRFKDLAGNEIVEFNVTYFDTITNDKIRKETLNSYPKEIVSWYKKYHAGKVTDSWVRLPAEVGVCFSFFDDGRPLFLNVIPATIEYEDAVDAEQEREAEEIRKIIVQKIPHLNDGQLLFEPEEALEMHTGAVGMLKGNKNVSVMTTYADVDAILSRTSSEPVNNTYIDKMYQNIYSNAGISSQIFSPKGAQILLISITNDMSLMMILANKYSRFISYILNKLFGNVNISFKYDILPVSHYNQKEFVETSLQLAQNGYSFLLPSAAMGVNQQALINLKTLENDVLDLGELLIPLSSSYTQSGNGNGEVGRPKKNVQDKADKTIQNEDSIDNQGGPN